MRNTPDTFAFTNEALAILTKHLVNMSENRTRIEDEFESKAPLESSKFNALLARYINQIHLITKNAEVAETTDKSFPIVTIGSEVEVEDLDNKEVFKFRLTIPIQGSPANGEISCLSPMGRSLMLQKAGDIITVRAPGGTFHYKIKSIQFP